MRIALVALVGVLAPWRLSAQLDYRNLDTRRPALIEDAYAVERYALELTVPTARLVRSKDGTASYGIYPELTYGLLPNTELSLGAALTERDRSWAMRGLELSALWNLNTETAWPALALRAGAELPVGGFAAPETEGWVAALLTRTFGRSRVHLNGGSGSDGLRWGGLVIDRTLPFHSTLLLAETYARRPSRLEPTQVNAGVGVRHQVTPTLVVDAGVWRGLRRDVGPAWGVTLGLSKAIGVTPGRGEGGSGTRTARAPYRPTALESRAERFYLPGAFNWAFLARYPSAARLFNAFDYGHAILYEKLYTEPRAPVSDLEQREYDYIVGRLLRDPPRLPIAEEAIAPAYAKLAWRAKRVFDWAHALHRQIYDVYADDGVTDKQAAVDRLVAYYLSNHEHALAPVPKAMRLMEGMPYSRGFRARYPKFNGLIWAYHWLQVGLYEPLIVARTPQERRALVDTAIARFWGMLDAPPSRMPRVMPMTPGVAPAFTERHPEAAAIFDNLHMLHDVISDILVADAVPDKRAAIYRALGEFQDASRDVMTREEWAEMVHHMGGVGAMGGAVLPLEHRH